MTKTRRIILNTFATYGRSVLAMVVGVFSSRWLLMGLGKVDLGLLNVVGGLIGAVVILETVMHVAVARFYAYAIGESQRIGVAAGRDEIRRWFNVVLAVYIVLPALVIAIGYPLGMYAIRNWLVIPPERMSSCIYVFRCSLFMTFVSMLAVPYLAMYKASQNIVELSLFDVARTVINFFFTFSLLYVACDKLKYAATFSMAVAAIMLSVQMWRARMLFPECRVKLEYMYDKRRMKQLFSYFFWEMFSCTGNMTREKAPAFILNKCYGPSVNAGWAVASTLSAQAMSLSGALMGALLPAVTTEEGAGKRENMIRMAVRTSKFGALMILVFSIPLIAEIDEVLRLWLVNPPEYTAGFCTLILIAFVIDKLGVGQHIAISANGKIGLYHTVVGTTYLMSVPIAILLLCLGAGVYSPAYMFLVCFSMVTVERILLARYLVRMPVAKYVKEAVVPLFLLSATTYVAACGMKLLMHPSFLRVVATTLVSLLIMSSSCWSIVLDAEEKAFIRAALRRVSVKLGMS